MAIGHTPMHEGHPGKIIEMPILTRHQKTGGNDCRWPSRLVTITVHVSAAILPVRIEFQFKKAGMDRSQETTIRTDLPPGKRRNGDPALRDVLEGTSLIPGGLWGHWWRQQFGDLRS